MLKDRALKVCGLLAFVPMVFPVAFGTDNFPVSETLNPLYLKGAETCPWWHADWKYRLPVVVCEMSTNKVANFTVDAEVDFGRAVKAESVRVVTVAGVEIPCWAEPSESRDNKRARVQFNVDLRAAENRLLFIYFGNESARRPVCQERVCLSENSQDYTVDNGRLRLDFAKDSGNESILRRLRIVGAMSPNEIASTPGGESFYAIAPSCVGHRSAEKVEITNVVAVSRSTPFVKTIHAENDRFSADFSLFAGSDRLEYSFKSKDALRRPIKAIKTSWVSGGGCAWDDFYYPSLTGDIRTMRAALDYRSDSGGEPDYPEFGNWCSEGWFVIHDRQARTSVGQFYVPSVCNELKHLHWDGINQVEWMTLGVKSGNAQNPQGEIRGAVFGTFADPDRIRHDWRVWQNPPRLIVGLSEPRREIPVGVPDMAHDFCSFVASFTPLRATEPDRKDRVKEDVALSSIYLKEMGFNGVMAGGMYSHYASMGLDRKTFDYETETITNSPFASVNKKTGLPNHPLRADFRKSEVLGRRLKETIKAYHAEGLGLFIWSDFMGNPTIWSQGDKRVKGDTGNRLCDLKCAEAMVKTGMDAVWCGIVGNEGPDFSKDESSRLTREYWRWPAKERAEYLDYLDSYVDHVSDYAKVVKKTNPRARVLAWGCDLGNVSTEQHSLECAGLVDVMIEEIMTGVACNAAKNKFSSARMRAMFDNEPHTVWNHFWERRPGDRVRIGNCDLAFTFGVNGFNQESDDYFHVDQDIAQMTADFNRFARCTGIGSMSARMAPVKWYTVFRDSRDWRRDVMEGALGHFEADWWPTCTRTDLAANGWAAAPLLQMDMTLNRYFTIDGLKRYRALILPRNRTMTAADFEIVKQYVSAGGVCYAEGKEFPFAAFMLAGAVPLKGAGLKSALVERSYGKGKFLYTPLELTQWFSNLSSRGDLRNALREAVGADEPIEFEGQAAEFMDGQLRTDGKNYFFGAFAAKTPDGKAAVVQTKLAIPRQKGLFALDLKSGRRTPFEGTLRYQQRPGECAFFLIGDEKVTSVPEHRVMDAGRYGANAPAKLLPGAERNLKEREALGDFNRPLVAVLFLKPEKDGSIKPNFRFAESALEQRLFSQTTYGRDKFVSALEEAKLLQFRCVEPAEYEKVFVECGDEIKAFLKRGGTLVFDQTATSPAAHRLLGEIGVFDPNTDGGRIKVHDGHATWVGDDKHPLRTSPWDLYEPWVSKYMQFEHCFVKWDKERQFAPFLAKPEWRPIKGQDAAMTIFQEKVLGGGLVVFQENTRAYTNWYESRTYGDNLLSYCIGMSVREHVRKVSLLNGGPGSRYERLLP